MTSPPSSAAAAWVRSTAPERHGAICCIFAYAGPMRGLCGPMRLRKEGRNAASREKALGWYHSDEYQELAKIRHAASTADFILIDARR